MVESYNTLGSTITITPTSTIQGVGFNNATAIVGTFDPSSGSATANDVETVDSTQDAIDKFGDGSELTRHIQSALPNPVGTIYAVGVDTTETTDSFASTSSGTLSNTAVLEPSLGSNIAITVTNTTDAVDVTVEWSYENSVTAPSTADTVVINPLTGDWAADSSASYDFTYQHANYDTAISNAASLNVRTIFLCTEDNAVTSIGQNELQTRARNIDFKRLFVGANPSIEESEVANYEPDTDDWRVVEIAPSRSTLPSGEDVRTGAAIAALAAAQPINVDGSVTYDSVSGLGTLAQSYPPTTAASFDRVTALTEDFEIAEGVTTSTEPAFRDIYACEIIDLITETVSGVLKQYRGGGNLVDDRGELSADLKTLLRSYATSRPPALGSGDGSDPYSVGVSQGATDTSANVTIGIEPAPIMKQISLNMNVGDVVTFEGASA